MKKKIYKSIITLMGVVCCSMCFLATPVASITAEAAASTVETGNEPQQHIKRWIYKEDYENGILWKRLWNCSAYEWEGDWIFVCYL